MAEVEQICDNVTIMRTGSVVYHGSIAALRGQAPGAGAPAHHHRRRPRRSRSPPGAAALEVTPVDGGLAVRGAAGRASTPTSPTSSTPASRCAASPRPRRRWRRCSSCSPRPPRRATADLDRRRPEPADDRRPPRHDRPPAGHARRADRPAPPPCCAGRSPSSPPRPAPRTLLAGAARRRRSSSCVISTASSGRRRTPSTAGTSTPAATPMPLLVLAFAAQWVLPAARPRWSPATSSPTRTSTAPGRPILTRSVSRGQIFWAKTLTAVALQPRSSWSLLAASTIASSLLIVGHQPLPGLTGQLIPPGTRCRWSIAELGDRDRRRCSASPPWRSCCRCSPATPPSASPPRSCSAWSCSCVGSLGGLDLRPPAAAHHPVRGLARPAHRSSPSTARSPTGRRQRRLDASSASPSAYLSLRRRDITGG